MRSTSSGSVTSVKVSAPPGVIETSSSLLPQRSSCTAGGPPAGRGRGFRNLLGQQQRPAGAVSHGPGDDEEQPSTIARLPPTVIMAPSGELLPAHSCRRDCPGPGVADSGDPAGGEGVVAGYLMTRRRAPRCLARRGAPWDRDWRQGRGARAILGRRKLLRRPQRMICGGGRGAMYSWFCGFNLFRRRTGCGLTRRGRARRRGILLEGGGRPARVPHRNAACRADRGANSAHEPCARPEVRLPRFGAPSRPRAPCRAPCLPGFVVGGSRVRKPRPRGGPGGGRRICSTRALRADWQDDRRQPPTMKAPRPRPRLGMLQVQ